MFWWTNETLNVWTHLLGWMYFAYLTVHELLEAYYSFGSVHWFDSAISILILVCFQVAPRNKVYLFTNICDITVTRYAWPLQLAIIPFAAILRTRTLAGCRTIYLESHSR